MGKAYKMCKVYNCHSMPDNVRKSFFENERAGNDCYVSVYVFDERCCIGAEPNARIPKWMDDFDVVEPENIVGQHTESDGLIWCYDKSTNLVSNWLYENGAEIGSQVIVSHNW